MAAGKSARRRNPSAASESAYAGGLYDYKKDWDRERLGFHRLPWWSYYLVAWGLVVLVVIGLLSYAFLRPPSVNFILAERPHLNISMRGLFYPNNFEELPQIEKNAFLQDIRNTARPHLDPELVEITPSGLLPIRTQSGRSAWQSYVNLTSIAAGENHLIIIVNNAGLSRRMTERLIELPAEITLNFTPYTHNLNQWVASARQRNHEILLTLPLEPQNTNLIDAGPLQLSADDLLADNLQKLNVILGLATGYIGVAASGESGFFANEDLLRPTFRNLENRGLIFFHPNPLGAASQNIRAEARALNLPLVFPDWIMRQAIDAEEAQLRLRRLEELVRLSRRPIIANFTLFPSTLERLERWLESPYTKSNIRLVSLSTIFRSQ